MLDCYYSNQQTCDGQSGILFIFANAQGAYFSMGCMIPPPPMSMATTQLQDQTTAGTPSPEGPCPSLPGAYDADLNMSQADISPKHQLSDDCAPPREDALRQCSLFMDSQLRAFNSSRVGLETCSLPGAWYLLHHHHLSIEVEGTNMEPSSNHTRLTRVNITFHSHVCNPVERTYAAFNTEPLPSDFAPALAEGDPSSLQMTFGQDQSVVTLMAPWLNATIIVRQYAQFLSVTLRVPREMSLDSEGLCTGCPSHMYVNLTSFLDLLPSLCPGDNNRALEGCFDRLANVPGLIEVRNNSYVEACVYSLFKTKSLDAFSMINAIASDARLLDNIGRDPPIVATLSSPFPTPGTLENSSASEQDATEEVSSTGEVSCAIPLQTLHWTLLLPILTLSIFR